ncbi:MAG: IS200/IS605 family element transposase accessory protein TnpB [Erysipelotrichales bacterium]|nr:IS200/IS605 family element transposase accessory protein TnpB [Erysipelotrichales bacterium]MBQ1386228.1 IS200/IS605 family element transposase accessory protein TnpB [Erysipelotrichales bacterium]MBQ2478542.1 IS200/IS605 family element transposase accessory protein TnpB [Erysipelotrichales bacterium]MBQ4375106.1 IS200/IS605 family element transposase accessory protein TnpB [Erysipelotrichales bacterium]
MQKGIKARLYPTIEQQETLNKTFGSCRFVYNHFLAERVRSYKEDETSLSYNKTAHLLTELKRDEDHLWLNEVDSMALQESLRNLDRAYQNFFKGNAGFPKFHSKHNRQSYRTRNQGNGIRIVGNAVRIPKIGLVKYKGLQPFEGTILNATVSKSASGKYYISLCVEMKETVRTNAGCLIGIDVGIKEFYTDSNGNTVSNPKTYSKHEKKLIREQRRLSRKQRGSNNRNKQRIRVAIQHEKIANIRSDFLHKVTTKLADENQVVCVEELNVKGMLHNHHLAKSISDVSWGEFFRLLDYKTAERGGRVVKVPTFYPSSQTCSNCGYKNPLVKDLAIRQWTCPVCGKTHDRDRNAAINILNKGLEVLAS